MTTTKWFILVLVLIFSIYNDMKILKGVQELVYISQQYSTERAMKSNTTSSSLSSLVEEEEAAEKAVTKAPQSQTTINTTTTTTVTPEIQRAQNKTMPMKIKQDDSSIVDVVPHPVVIDVVVAGSVTMPELHEAQRQTFGQHVSVRHFFVATEEDDFEKHCTESLTRDDVQNIQHHCWNFGPIAAKKKGQRLLAGLMGLSLPDDILDKKTNPVGWLCAQKRPLAGFMKAMKYYAEHDDSKPDYMIILDDDTYVNIDLIVHHLATGSYDPEKDAMVLAGCMMPVRVYYQDRYVSNFDIPFGGFGSILSRRTLHDVSQPFNCSATHPTPFETSACQQLERNTMDEQALFEDGMSIADLMYRYATADFYANYRNWTDTAKSCWHSDWYWGYFMNWYAFPPKPMKHLREPKQQKNHGSARFGITPYQDSQYDFTQKPPTKSGQCYNDNHDNCTISSHFCHYVSPDQMINVTNQLKRDNPHQFKPFKPKQPIE